MKGTLFIGLITCCMCAFAQHPSVQIRQVESQLPIRLGYDTINNHIIGIHIPFEFEFSQNPSVPFWIAGVDYSIPNEFGAWGKYGGWSSAHMDMELGDRYTIEPDPGEIEQNQFPNPAHYRVFSRREISEYSELQDSLRRYVQYRNPGATFVMIGSLAEFKARHPQLVDRLLGRDSVLFRIYDWENKRPVEFLRLPVEY